MVTSCACPGWENIAATDVTRPPTVLSPGAARSAQAAVRDGTSVPKGMRLVNGRFVRVLDLAADRSGDAAPAAPDSRPAPAAKPPSKDAPPTESWAVTFGTRLDPSDLPSHP